MTTTAKRIVIFFAIVAILGLPATSMASERVVSFTVPIDDAIWYGNCPSVGEEIVFEGTRHIVVREDVFTPGGIHQNYHDNFMQVSGTGMTTGNRYVIQTVFNLHSNLSQSGESAWEYEITQILRIVSQKSGDNFYLHVVTKLTLGPNGETHAQFQFVSEECRG